MRTVSSENPSDAWVKSLGVLVKDGKKNGQIIELMNLVNRIKNPTHVDPEVEEICRMFVSAKSIRRATSTMLKEGAYRGKTTYWERLTNWHGNVNQLKMVTERILEKPNSKHLSCSILDPSRDWKKMGFMPSQPCLLAIDFRLRGGVLSLTAFFRSQDVFNIAYTDFKALGTYLQSVASGLRPLSKNYAKSRIGVGELVCLTTSAFIHPKDLRKVLGLLKENGRA
jgi:thymidylate synthase